MPVRVAHTAITGTFACSIVESGPSSVKSAPRASASMHVLGREPGGPERGHAKDGEGVAVLGENPRLSRWWKSIAARASVVATDPNG